jgi:hypothetical protein
MTLTKQAREFTDERLCSLLVSSAHLTLGVVDFPADYTVDIPNSGISPTPTNDKSFVNLVVLKAACLLSCWRIQSVHKSSHSS